MEQDVQMQKQISIIEKLISKHSSGREFARSIGEDNSDLIKWRRGRLKLHPRACMKITKTFGIHPHELRPDIFDADLIISFKGSSTKISL